MLPLISGYDDNPAVISLSLRVSQSGKVRHIAMIPVGFPFLVSIPKLDMRQKSKFIYIVPSYT